MYENEKTPHNVEQHSLLSSFKGGENVTKRGTNKLSKSEGKEENGYENDSLVSQVGRIQGIDPF